MNTNSINPLRKREHPLKTTNKWKWAFVIFGKYSKQFTSQTTLHAFSYIGQTNLTYFERGYFLAFFWIVVVFAYMFSTNIYDKWDSMPILLAMEPHTTLVSTVPFPSITICNMNQAAHSKVKAYPSHSLEKAMTRKICFLETNFSRYDDLKPTPDTNSIGDFIIRSAQPCENMIVYCKFAGQERNCDNFFRPILQDEGYCCAFNVLHPAFQYKGEYKIYRDYDSTTGRLPINWNLENGYPKDLPPFYYPRKGLGAGISLGFTILLNANMTEYYCSSTFGAGFKVIPHSPIDTPHVKETGLTIMVGSESRFRFSVDNYKALPSIRSISPKRRQCYFYSEVSLLYYKYYTRRNCEMECDAKYFLSRCNCIPFQLPRIFSNASVCHVKDFNCEVQAESEFNKNEHYACKLSCLPSCFSLEYITEVFSTPLANSSYNLRDKVFRNYTTEVIQQNFAMVHFYYNEETFRSKVRSPYTSFTDYLSQTGGLMGLMMGFSVISICEVIYFFLMRPVFDCLLKRPIEEVENDDGEDTPTPAPVITLRNRSNNHNPFMAAKRQGIVRNLILPDINHHDIGNLKKKFKRNNDLDGDNSNDVSPPYFPYVE